MHFIDVYIGWKLTALPSTMTKLIYTGLRWLHSSMRRSTKFVAMHERMSDGGEKKQDIMLL
jgi:hypothetical protein